MSAARALLGRLFPELFAFALGVALSFDRLLGVPGPERALLVGALVAPPLAACTAGRSPAPTARASLARAPGRPATTLLPAFAPLVLHSLFVPFCGRGSALAFVALGPAIGLPLAALVGAAARALCRRRGPAVAASLTLTLGSVAAGVAEFWLTP